jgi:DNA-3-methyladenine glycosylase
LTRRQKAKQGSSLPAASPNPAAIRGVRLTRHDYAKRPARLARELLGCVLVRILPDGTRLAGRIVETEAYEGAEDRAAHSFGGRRTPRVEPMYGRPGTVYVYFTYGMHHCMNVVCGKKDEPVAVLIRALEPIEGLVRMRAHRATQPSKRGSHKPRIGQPPRDADLCRGPASLCRALAIDIAMNADDLTTSPDLWIERGTLRPAERASVRTTPRIGVAYAGACALRPLRFLVGSSGSVSGPRPRRSTRSGA